MTRIPNTRPTTIYWLVDVRPETLAHAPNGVPFYCGKTVGALTRRFAQHQNATKKHPRRPLSFRLVECAGHVRTVTMETVPADVDWRARECWWIATLKSINPNAVNVSRGGDGAPGLVHSAETREKLRLAHTGRTLPQEQREKISASNKGKKRSPEVRARMKGRKLSDAHRAKLIGRTHSDEARDKIGAAHRGKIVSDETRAKLRFANLGKRASAETRQKISIAGTGRKFSVRARRGSPSSETREKIRIALLGKKHSAERNAKRSAALRGRTIPPETRARMRTAQQMRRAVEAAHV